MDGLEVKNVSISFGGIKALNDVSFSVRPGEIVGLIGPNGAGKTSLINCVSRYYHPTHGGISFNGQDLIVRKPHHLPRIGISRSFQELSLPPNLSVIETVMLGLHSEIQTNILRALFDFGYLKSQDHLYRRKARDIMRFFTEIRARSEKPQSEMGFPDISGRGGYPDLLDVQDVPVGVLPYGVRRKLDLARAFVSRPKLLLLDEPAAGLGSSDLDEVVNLIKAARQEFNTAVLLVEHHMALVSRLCDRIVVLDFGEKIAEGTPQEIKQHPAVIEAYLGTKAGVRQHTTPEVSADSALAEVQIGEPILEVKGIDLHYGPVKALSGVSLKIADHSITTVLGSNGAGKSSLLRAISGIERLTNGEILYKGEQLSHYLQEPRADKVVRQGIIHVPEGRRIFKELSIMENLKAAAYTVRDRKRIKQNLDKVFHYFPKLKDKLKLKDAGNLSGGQQQMLAIGQALMMDPRVLLLDEPSLGLSPNLVEELFEIIKSISENEDCSILLVEQNAELAMGYSKYTYVLETGFLVRQGMSSQLRQAEELSKLYLGS